MQLDSGGLKTGGQESSARNHEKQEPRQATPLQVDDDDKIGREELDYDNKHTRNTFPSTMYARQENTYIPPKPVTNTL